MPVYIAYGGSFFEPVLGDSEMVVRANNILGLRVCFFLMATTISFIFPYEY